MTVHPVRADASVQCPIEKPSGIIGMRLCEDSLMRPAVGGKEYAARHPDIEGLSSSVTPDRHAGVGRAGELF